MTEMKNNLVNTDDVVVKKQNQFVEVFKRLRQRPSAMVGLTLLTILILIALLSPWIIPYNYAKIDVLNANQPPSSAHWFGTDQIGRDILSRCMYGARYSLTLGILATLIGTAIGLVFGSIAGYFGGKTDDIMMRITDVFESIPGMVLNIAVACAVGPGFFNTIWALSIGGISGTARMIRAQILKIRSQEFIEAAEVTNCSTTKVIIKHLLPNAISPTLVGMAMGVGWHIMGAAGLSYLGLGVQPPTPEWGAMLADARAYLAKYPWMCIFPGVCIMITVLSFNLMGDGLRDAMDPKLKK